MANNNGNPIESRELRVIIGQKTEDFTVMLENWGKQFWLQSPFVYRKAGNNRKYNKSKRK